MHMWEMIGSVGIMVVVVGVPCLGWIITSIVRTWSAVRISEHLAALKQSMIERGMSAEDIERVIKAGAAVEEEAAKSA